MVFGVLYVYVCACRPFCSFVLCLLRLWVFLLLWVSAAPRLLSSVSPVSLCFPLSCICRSLLCSLCASPWVPAAALCALGCKPPTHCSGWSCRRPTAGRISLGKIVGDASRWGGHRVCIAGSGGMMPPEQQSSKPVLRSASSTSAHTADHVR